MEIERVDRFFEKHGRRAPRIVRETLEVRRLVHAFRTLALRSMEEGVLADYIKTWYLEFHGCAEDDYPEPLEHRNPYAGFKKRNPRLSTWYKQLDFLLEEIPLSCRESFRFTLPTSQDDLSELSVALLPGESLARLITQSPYLTHHENIAMAVMDARLWLRSSSLPVVIGSDVSYNDVRHKNVPIPSRLSDGFPSLAGLSVQRRTIELYWSVGLKSNPEQLEVVHPAPCDFPPGDDSSDAVLARLRYPRVQRKGIPFQRTNEESLDEYAAVGAMDQWRCRETHNMYTFLVKLVYRMTPSMHLELKERLDASESDSDSEDGKALVSVQQVPPALPAPIASCSKKALGFLSTLMWKQGFYACHPVLVYLSSHHSFLSFQLNKSSHHLILEGEIQGPRML